MNKAKLIKRDQIAEVIQPKKTKTQSKPVVRKTMEAVNNWIDARRNQRVDPRAAFAALFIQPQEN